MTKEQGLIINTIMYSGFAENPVYENMTVGEMVEAQQGNIPPEMVDMVRNDSKLSNLQIVDVHYDSATGETNCLFVDTGTNEAILAFRGTGDGEWHDNFIAGDPGHNENLISPQQQSALDWVSSHDLSGYDHVTVTGHSKGGNKAKMVTLFNPEVDSCISYDGQGFSDEFYTEYQMEIALNQHKIENHNASEDYVNLLLNDVGETHYYETYNTQDGFASNHAAESMMNLNDGTMVDSQQNPLFTEADHFLNSYLRTVSPEEKSEVLDFAGQIFQLSPLGYNDSDALMELVCDPEYTDELVNLLNYLLYYAQTKPEVLPAIYSFLDELDMGFVKYVIDFAIEHPDFSENFIEGLVNFGLWAKGDDIPQEVKDLLKRLAAGLEINADYGEIISGADMAVGSTGLTPKLFVNTDVLATLANRMKSIGFELERESAQLNRLNNRCPLIWLETKGRKQKRALDKMEARAHELSAAVGKISEIMQRTEEKIAAAVHTVTIKK